LLSNRWDTGWGEFGALFNASFAQTNFRDQTVTAGAAVPFRMPDAAAPLERLFPPLWEPGQERGLPFEEGSTLDDGTEYVLSRDAVFQPDFTGERERPAWNLSLQFAPNETSQYTFEVFYNGFRQKTFNSLFFTFVDWWGNVDPTDPVVFYEGTNIIKERFVNDAFGFNSGDYAKSKTDSHVYSLGGLWDFTDRFTLEAEFVYQESFYQNEFFALQTERVAPRLHVDFNSGNGIPVVEFFDDPATPVNESDMTQAALWAMGPMFDNGEKFEGRAVTFTEDGNYEADWGIVRNIGFGLRYDERNAEEFTRTDSRQAVSCGGCTVADFPGILHVNSGFYDGNANVPSAWAAAGADWLEANADVLRGAYGLPSSSDLSLTPNFEIDEEQIALYLQAEFEKEVGGGVFDGQVGVRYLTVDTNMTFTDVNSFETSSASNSVSKMLPNIMLRYNFAEDWLARVSYGETVRLPNFNDLNATITYVPDVTDIGYGTATGGNPNLDPTESRNYDVSLEWYFAEGSAVYGTWFKRDIEGFVVSFRNPVIFDLPDDDPDRGPYTFILSQPDNTSNGVLDGFEFGLVYFPTNLPGWLNGAGIQATYTMLDSEQEIPVTNEVGEIVGTDILPIFGVSDTSYNVILAYDRYDFDMRLSYVWREDFLQRNEAALFANPLGIYRSPEESLDFQLSWAVNENFTLTFDATNLTEEIYHEYYEFPDIFNFSNSLFSRTFALGVRFQM
jgi:TonB-dependent receptor